MSRFARQLCQLALLSAALGGCGKVRQISACRAVARDVNAAVTEVEALAQAKPPDEQRIARRYGELARTLEPRTNGVTPLASALRDYVSVVRATEATLKARAELPKLPYVRVGESAHELERLVKRERGAVSRIEAECGAR